MYKKVKLKFVRLLTSKPHVQVISENIIVCRLIVFVKLRLHYFIPRLFVYIRKCITNTLSRDIRSLAFAFASQLRVGLFCLLAMCH